MADVLFQKVLNNEIEIDLFLDWLFKVSNKEQSPQFIENQCSQHEFINYFLNYIHKGLSKNRGLRSDLDKSLELDKSKSFVQDSSKKSDVSTSTPKFVKNVASCPISPLDCSNSSTKSTKKASFNNSRGSLVLGDFIVKKNSPASKNRPNKSTNRSLDFGNNRKRINPTNLTASIENSRQSFDFNSSFFNNNSSEISVDSASQQRSILAKERLEIANKIVDRKTSLKSINTSQSSGEVIPVLNSVSDVAKIDLIVRIYSELIRKSMVFNVVGQVHLLIGLLLRKQIDCKSIDGEMFRSLHNSVYFAVRTLEMIFDDVLVEFDKSTLKLLGGNLRLMEFSPEFGEKLLRIDKRDRSLAMGRDGGNVFFDCDTDNRRNFPNDRSFHAFRKQRDCFFEILKLWEDQRSTSATTDNFANNFETKVRNLLETSKDPANFYHFARLFKSQILSTCQSIDTRIDKKSISSLPSIDEDKLNKLKSRFVNKPITNGLNSPPTFPGRQEFYKEFIQVGANHHFNCHLSDSLIASIVTLNEANLSNNDEDHVDDVSRASYFDSLKSLKLLAKFLGFLHSLPYKSDVVQLSDNLIENQVAIRKQSCPVFDVRSLLESSATGDCLILSVPWVTDYLSMLDRVTLRLPYYVALSSALLRIYRTFRSVHLSNTNLVKFCVGWLFDLPNHRPQQRDNNKLTVDVSNLTGGSVNSRIDLYDYVDQDVLYYCCPYLGEIKKVLMENYVLVHNGWAPLRHITPVSAIALRDPNEPQVKLQKELEEAFFKNHPGWLKRTVDFASERISSACVKRLHGNVVPMFRRKMVDELSAWIADTDEDEEMPDNPIVKVDEVLSRSWRVLQDSCAREVDEFCEERIATVIGGLLDDDVLSQVKDAAVKLTKRHCKERISCWVDEHVTLPVLAQDCLDELKRTFSRRRRDDSCSVTGAKPVFVLPPDGKAGRSHNDATRSAADLIEAIRDLSVRVTECQVEVTEESLLKLLNDVRQSESERADINQCAMAAICESLVELSLILIAKNWTQVFTEAILDGLVAIWNCYHGDTDDLLKSLLCARTILMFRDQSPDVASSWNCFARFCFELVRKGALGIDNFETQCTAIYRTNWDADTLKLVTNFYRSFVDLYRADGNSYDGLVDFFSDFCEDLN